MSGKTFALPNVEVGDIIEYRYRETREGETASYMRLYFQRDIPMWSVTYHIKPLDTTWSPYAMRAMAFQCNNTPFQKEPDGYFATSATSVTAFREEPSMPPEDQLKAWLLIYYEEDKKIDPVKFWQETGKDDYSHFKPLTSANDLVKKTAAEVISGISPPRKRRSRLSMLTAEDKNSQPEQFRLSDHGGTTRKRNQTEPVPWRYSETKSRNEPRYRPPLRRHGQRLRL